MDFTECALIPIAPMKLARSGHCMVYLQNFIYVIGGFSEQNDFTTRCERLNLADYSWSEIASLNHKCHNACVTAFDDKFLFKFGGKLGEDKINKYVEKYNP